MANVRQLLMYSLLVSVPLSSIVLYFIVVRYLTPYEVGEYFLVVAYTSALFAFSTMQSRVAIPTDIHHQYSYAEYRTLVFSLSTFAFLISLVLVFIFDLDFYFVLAFSLSRILLMVYDVEVAVQSALGHRNVFTITQFISSMLFVLLTAVFLELGVGIYGIVLANTLGVAVGMVYTRFYSAGVPFAFRFDYKRLGKLFIKLLPLGVSVCIYNFVSDLPRVYLSKFVSIEAVSFYTTIAYFITLPRTILLMMSGVFLHDLGQVFIKFGLNSVVRRLALYIVALVGCAIIGVALGYYLGYDVLRIFFGEAYAAYSYELVVMLSGLIFFVGDFILFLFVYMFRQFHYQYYKDAIAVIYALTAMPYIISQYGVLGATLSLLILFALLCFTSLCFALYIGIRYKQGKITYVPEHIDKNNSSEHATN